MKSVFVTGSGQCGETFLFNLFKNNNKIIAKDESRPLIHSYYKFAKYNNMNIDEAPLIEQLSKVIKSATVKRKIAFESSSFLALHTLQIYKEFNSKFIILLRNPFDVSYSLKKKEWYKEKYIKKDKKKIIGYQGVASSFHNKHHNFCRLSPKGKYFSKWNNLDQILKIKWYWNEIYTEIFHDLKKIPKKNYKIFRIEDFDYNKYLELSKWMGVKPLVSRLFFNIKIRLVEKNPEKTKRELKEFSKFKSKIEKLYYKENLIF